MYSIGTRFKMKCLYLDGIELCREQLADEPHYDDDLIIKDWASSDNLFKHSICKAQFLDPVIVKMTSDQMLLRGYQIRRINGEGVHTAQCWLLKLASAT